MKIANKRTWNIIAIFALLLSLITPSFVFADEEDKSNAPYPINGGPDDYSLTIYKYEPLEEGEEVEDWGDSEEVDGYKPLEGVEFTLIQTHSFDPETDTWEEVDSADEITGTTDASGRIIFTEEDGLELGRYEIEETDAPDHILINPEIGTVDIPMTNEEGTELDYHVKIHPKNETIEGNVELEKVDEDGDPIEGVKFNLYDDEDNLIKEDLETDENGIITVSGLSAGDYYFVEQFTEGIHDPVDEDGNGKGIALNEEKIHFTVKRADDSNDTTTIDWEPIRQGEDSEFVNEDGTVTNYKKPELEKDVEGEEEYQVDREREFEYNLTITVPQDIEKYVKLGVYDILDPRLEHIANAYDEVDWSVTGADEDLFDYNKDEEYVNDDGEETTKLSWYVKDDKFDELTPDEEFVISFKAKIKADAELDLEVEDGVPNTGVIDFDNDRGDDDEIETPPVIVTPLEGGLKIIKVDKDDGTRLEGAEFKLVYAEDDGELGVKAGDVVDTKDTIITVNGEEHDGLLENLVTDVDGELVIEGLTPGNYELVETKAPTYEDEDGETHSYRLLTKPVKIEITADQTENLEVTVENSKSGWDLPSTGGIGTLIFSVLGLAIMGGALLASRRKKEEQTA